MERCGYPEIGSFVIISNKGFPLPNAIFCYHYGHDLGRYFVSLGGKFFSNIGNFFPLLIFFPVGNFSLCGNLLPWWKNFSLGSNLVVVVIFIGWMDFKSLGRRCGRNKYLPCRNGENRKRPCGFPFP